ncbi:hypothetical protein ABZW03_22010 [Kitasatospora sp. NPDC004799]|uniref:hypothetical protein n=1 Tax=Kitasatospora sp. NPDC004799 TaxID=3154460 RepID=UPI0033BA6247
MRDEPNALDGPEAPFRPDEQEATDWPELPPYRSYTWEGEDGDFHMTLYPGEEEADEERKAEFRAMGARMLADLNADREAERTPPFPGLRRLQLVRDEDPD